MHRATPGLTMLAAAFLGIASLLSPVRSAALERISFSAPQVSSDQAALKGSIQQLLDQAAALLDRLYGGSVRIVSPAEPGEYAAATIASEESHVLSLVVVLTRGSDGSRSPSLVWSAPVTPDLPLWLARAVFLLWSSFHGYLADQTTEAPLLVDDLPASVLSATMPPLGIAVAPPGNLVVALVTSCLELDHAGKVLGQPARSLADTVPLFAGSVQATPAGTLLLKPTMGRDLYRVQPDAEQAQRIPTGLELSTIFYWAAMADGSALLVDSTHRRAYSVAPGRRRQELPLFPNPTSWPTAWATGPDGTIWAYDPSLRGVRVFTAEGTPLDIVLPLADPSAPVAATAMAVGPDGSLVLLSSAALSRFRPDGRLAWTLTSLAGSDQPSLPASASLAVDWSRGLIYLCDVTGRRIVKLLDRAWCRQRGIRDEFEESVIALRAGRTENEAAADAAIAHRYEAVGSRLMAKAWWQRVEDADPGNPDAAARLLAIEVSELREAAQELDARARSTLSAIGIETARPLSVQAIQKYELLLSKAPDDEASRRAMESLRQRFSQGAPEPQKPRPLSVTTAHLANLFPSLMIWYGLHPPGSVTVSNPLPEPVEKVRASLFIPGFMDFPAESPAVAQLLPGQSVQIALTPRFNQKVLELQEDMAVQAQVTIAWVASGQEQSSSRTASATIYRNTALTWDDTRKISSYITPNESTVKGFASRALTEAPEPSSPAGAGSPRPGLSRSFLQAIRIIDALGSYGITYVQNQDAPFSRALGKAQIIDTVHFPRVTLYNRTGDCSDTTALLCSLLESAGIRTAAITTPGHIFMAFDSEEPAENAPFLSSDALQTIQRNGTVWIPVETTVLSRGFLAAWEEASALVRKYSATGPYEFIPVAQMRDLYPPLPLAPASLTVAEPSASMVGAATTASLSRLTEALYTAKLVRLDAELGSLSGRRAVQVRLREGILHAMFGRLPQAEAAFRAAIAAAPVMVSPYVNLANVRLLSGDPRGALVVVRQGLDRNPDSVLLNLAAARICSTLGEAERSAAYFAKVQKSAPDLASRFAGLAPGAASASSRRAAQEGAAPQVIWSDE